MRFKQAPNSKLLLKSLCSKFEQKHTLKLPGDYKSFLCTTINGGTLSCKETSISLPNGDVTTLNSFLGIGVIDEYNIEKNIWMLGEERLPSHMIPIADDPGGNFFFLQASGKTSGKVYFYNHEEQPNYPPAADNNPSLTLIADTFTNFLESIECIEY